MFYVLPCPAPQLPLLTNICCVFSFQNHYSPFPVEASIPSYLSQRVFMYLPHPQPAGPSPERLHTLFPQYTTIVRAAPQVQMPGGCDNHLCQSVMFLVFSATFCPYFVSSGNRTRHMAQTCLHAQFETCFWKVFAFTFHLV